MNNQVNNAGDFLGNLVASIATAIPKALGALLILLIGYFIAKALCKVVKSALNKANLDGRVHSGQGGNVLQKAIPSPTNLLGKVAFWLVFLVAVSMAVGALEIDLLTKILAGIYAYIPNVLAAILIFLVAGGVSGAVAGFVTRTMGDTATGKIVSTAAPVVIMAIAGFMILNQLMIAPAIVVITYAALLGSAGLGLALAFGLGGRTTAERIVADAYNKGQGAKRRGAQDAKVGQARAQQDVQAFKQRIQ